MGFELVINIVIEFQKWVENGQKWDENSQKWVANNGNGWDANGGRWENENWGEVPTPTVHVDLNAAYWRGNASVADSSDNGGKLFQLYPIVAPLCE